MLNHFVNESEMEYEHHPRLLFLSAITLFYLLIFFQSYFASPVNLLKTFSDTWEMLIFLIPLSLIILKLKTRNLLIFGLFYTIFGLSLTFLKFPGFIKVEYAVISFCFAVWYIADWCSYKKLKKSLLSELVKGNYYIAFGLLLSSVVLGSIIEFLNAPVGLWWYRWPFPSIEIYGIPVFLAAFGWFPWIASILAVFYPFTFKKPKKL